LTCCRSGHHLREIKELHSTGEAVSVYALYCPNVLHDLYLDANPIKLGVDYVHTCSVLLGTLLKAVTENIK
jgi:hypothetical protein